LIASETVEGRDYKELRLQATFAGRVPESCQGLGAVGPDTWSSGDATLAAEGTATGNQQSEE
jgi:hypothetical protein